MFPAVPSPQGAGGEELLLAPNSRAQQSSAELSTALAYHPCEPVPLQAQLLQSSRVGLRWESALLGFSSGDCCMIMENSSCCLNQTQWELRERAVTASSSPVLFTPRPLRCSLINARGLHITHETQNATACA